MSKKKNAEQTQQEFAQQVQGAGMDVAAPGESAAGEQLAQQVAAVAESKESKFRRLANKRVPKALAHIEFVRNLSNKNTYGYTKADADAIIAVLQDAVKKCKDAFGDVKESKNTWTLPTFPPNGQ